MREHLLCMCLLADKLLALGRGTNYELGNKQIVESRSVTENAQVLSSYILVLTEADDRPDNSSWCRLSLFHCTLALVRMPLQLHPLPLI